MMRAIRPAVLGVLFGLIAGPSLANTTLANLPEKIDCDAVEKIRFDKDVYKAKSPSERRLVDAQQIQCEIDAEAAKSGIPAEEAVVVVVNPIPTGEHDRVFYGKVKKKDVENGARNCKASGAAAGIAIAVVGTASGTPGAAETGATIYQYSDVACSSLESAILGDNLMAVLAPTAVVGNAVAGKALNDIIANVPLVSGADKKKIQNLVNDAVASQTPSVTITKDKVHVDIGIGGGIGIKRPF